VDGHDIAKIGEVFAKINGARSADAHIIFANTIKGKGVSFMENKLEWHYRSPNEEEFRKASEELR
jgi:transketolase